VKAKLNILIMNQLLPASHSPVIADAVKSLSEFWKTVLVEHIPGADLIIIRASCDEGRYFG
jgi:hypothetical protein